METKKTNEVSSNDAVKMATETTTMKQGQKKPEIAKDKNDSKDENDSKSGVNDTRPTKTDAKPALKVATQDLKTKPRKANVPGPEGKQEVKETKETKVDVTRKRIRTYLKPRVPTFRKQGSKKKAVKESAVQANPMKKNRRPPLSKLQSKSKVTKRNARGVSPSRGAQKARFQRKPPVPRFATTKRRKIASKKKENLVNTSSSRQNMGGYHRRFKRKPALPDFTASRKQKRKKIVKGKQEQSKSKIIPGMKVGKPKDLGKSTDSRDSTVSETKVAVVQKEIKSETGATSTQGSQKKIVESEQKKAISATSDTAKKDIKANIRSTSKACGKSVNSGIGKSVKVKQRLKCPKARLHRGRNVKMMTKSALPKGSEGKIKIEASSTKKKETVGNSKGDKSSKESFKCAVNEADKMKGVNAGHKKSPAGGGSFEKDQESEKSSTVM